MISKDGTLTRDYFRKADVILRPIADIDKEKVWGHLLHSNAEYERRSDPYLAFDLYVPESRLDKICDEIIEERLSEIQIGVHVDLFQSEVEGALSEPGMPRTYYVEAESIFNRSYLSWLCASKIISASEAEKKQSDHRDESMADSERLLEGRGLLRLIRWCLRQVKS